MKAQVCEITNGTLRHFYVAPNGRIRMSRTHATTLPIERAREIIKNYSHHNLFIQSEYDCHFRKTDSDNRILN